MSVHYLTKAAIREGWLTKRDLCSECGKRGRVLGHHDDYAKPLEIRWLCAKCHAKWHSEHGDGKNRHLSGIADTVVATHQNYSEMVELIRSGWTLQRVGERYGVSRERVRQIVGSPKQIRPAKEIVHVEVVNAMRREGKTLKEIAQLLSVSSASLAKLHPAKRIVEQEHGTIKEYRRGCRCSDCRAANTEFFRSIRGKKRAA